MKLTESLNKSLDRLPGFVRDILFVVVVVGGISLLSQITLGSWTPMVAVESGSMVPNLNIGDIVLVQGASRTQVVPWDVANETGYQAFNKPGDVILYRPYGKEKPSLLDALASIVGRPISPDKATPIIHRALYRVEKGEAMWQGGPPAPFDGYITKGDHNSVIDQMAGEILGAANPRYLTENAGEISQIGDGMYLDRRTGLVLFSKGNQTLVGSGISYLTPVRDEWVLGVARVRIPYVGYVRLVPGMITNFIKDIFWGS